MTYLILTGRRNSVSQQQRTKRPLFPVKTFEINPCDVGFREALTVGHRRFENFNATRTHIIRQTVAIDVMQNRLYVSIDHRLIFAN